MSLRNIVNTVSQEIEAKREAERAAMAAQSARAKNRREEVATLLAELETENRIVVETEGGIVQAVFFNKAANDTRWLVIDHDTDGLAPDEVRRLANGDRVYRSTPRDDTLSFKVLDRVAAGQFDR